MYGSSNKSNSDGSTVMYGANYEDVAYSYRTDNHGKSSWFSINGNVDYQRTSKKNKQRMITLSYKVNTQPQTSDSYSTYLDILPDERKDELIENLKLYNYHSDGKTNTMEQTFQVDYTTPIGKLHTIETGVKYIFRQDAGKIPETEKCTKADRLSVPLHRSIRFRYLRKWHKIV